MMATKAKDLVLSEYLRNLRLSLLNIFGKLYKYDYRILADVLIAAGFS